jgi:hypothetical protein
MPDSTEESTPGRKPETIEEREYRRAHVPRHEARGLAWLPWRSHGLEHGDRPHKVGPDGIVQEIGDRAIKPKPEGIRVRQARRFARGRRS